MPATPAMPGLTRPARARWVLVAVLGVSLVAPRLSAQAAYVRFDITSVDDSTFTFATTGANWVKPSRAGFVVDPLHGDELIAKFRVTKSHKGSATAVVTGQTERLSLSDVALLTKPHPLFLTRPWFWAAFVVGGVIGYVAHGH